MGCIAIQPSQACDTAWHCACDTAQELGVGRWGAGRSGQSERVREARAAGGRWAGAQQAATRCRQAAQARGRQAHGGRQALRARPAGRPGRGLGAAWARPGRAAGPMGCAFGALSLF